MSEGGIPTLAYMLDLCTSHVDRSAGFGDLRIIEHEYGWVVFVDGNKSGEAAQSIPEWIRPIHSYAAAQKAMIINFDADADEVEGWKVYE